MGIRYSASIDVASSPAPGAAYAELLSMATGGAVVHAIRVESLSGAGGNVGLTRAFAIGTGIVTGPSAAIATGLPHRLLSPTMPVGSALTRLQAAWSSSGLTPTGFVSLLRTAVFPGVTGTLRELWRSDIDGPLAIEPRGSLLFTNQGTGVATGAGLKISVTWEEGDSASR